MSGDRDDREPLGRQVVLEREQPAGYGRRRAARRPAAPAARARRRGS